MKILSKIAMLAATSAIALQAAPVLADDILLFSTASGPKSGPIPAVHGVVRWRIIDLCQWIWDEFQITVAEQTLGRATCDEVSQAVRAPAPPCASGVSFQSRLQ